VTEKRGLSTTSLSKSCGGKSSGGLKAVYKFLGSEKKVGHERGDNGGG